MIWRSIPFKVKEGMKEHETREDAVARAQKVANKTGDWCAVQQPGGPIEYIQSTATARRRA